ncbi:helix-turn-helix domain-containing protein [Heyndrickxia ginsengihumi]|uniref:Helix-turn-helix transcriptional regulator n=1 Tax=Heyndrickxia ginsengihumi TaxID=363870 RepID=A0A0A6VCX9_9BACI|nr:helix-turn-helix transcriptional regulator [Heyndrickxia ginsengihumi]KHD85323.1 XRE family transcriptional regulator [Heyndrickxia ginsengihumi]MCM3024404.1 helix-turn-helix transcriptional regulator [Heyndrickxia ginsengihumi]NEY21484.1 helix-turn-helix transcriptional regulator [Heyndrickxia ginsengihumi]
MFGWGGKPRSRFGIWLDQKGISQEWVSKQTKISRNTISKIASNKEYSPNLNTIKKIMKAIKEVDPRVKSDDFFDL